MALQTTEELLIEVRKAITETLAYQAITYKDRQVQKARLADLTAREEMLLTRYQRETGTGGPAIMTGVLRRY